MVDITNPQYIISELIGSLPFFAILAVLLIVYICAKLKFNFQTMIIIIVFALGTFGTIAYGNIFIIIATIVGIIVGIIFYSLLNKG